MIAIFQKMAAFARWLAAPEQLPQAPIEDQREFPQPVSFVRWVLSGAELASPEFEKSEEVRTRSFLRWVMSPERLPDSQDEPYSGGGAPVSFWRWVLSNEELPELKFASAPSVPEGGLLSWVLSAEVCPTSPEAPPGSAPGFLDRLLSSEVCPTGEPVTGQR